MENKGSVSADAKKKQCLDTAGESSSADTGSEHLFPHTESTNASTEKVNGNPTLDTDNLDIPDSLTLARVDRENQGPWGAEYSYGGEADLHLHFNNCAKNPGHKDFIPVDKFSIDDLPERYRDPDIVDYIRALSDLTVRVAVNYVSDRRPATVRGTDKPYPGYDNRGQRRLTVGTGWVHKVKINLDLPGYTCKCKDCRNSSTPETTFAVIYITTAKHVVFDDLEVEHTTCHLFFDSGGTPEACSGVVTLTDMEVSYSDLETDHCYMKHFTHDLHLGDRLSTACRQKYDLMIKLPEILPEITKYEKSLNVADKQPLLIIVSHPHGCSKHISIGRWTSIYYDITEDLTYEYTTATCPGSSGAIVVMPHKCSIAILGRDLGYVPGAHCGTSEERPGVNFFKQVYVMDKMESLFSDEDLRDKIKPLILTADVMDKMEVVFSNEDGVDNVKSLLCAEALRDIIKPILKNPVFRDIIKSFSQNADFRDIIQPFLQNADVMDKMELLCFDEDLMKTLLQNEDVINLLCDEASIKRRCCMEPGRLFPIV